MSLSADAVPQLPAVQISLDAPAVKRLKATETDIPTLLHSEQKTRKNKRINPGQDRKRKIQIFTEGVYFVA